MNRQKNYLFTNLNTESCALFPLRSCHASPLTRHGDWTRLWYFALMENTKLSSFFQFLGRFVQFEPPYIFNFQVLATNFLNCVCQTELMRSVTPARFIDPLVTCRHGVSTQLILTIDEKHADNGTFWPVSRTEKLWRCEVTKKQWLRNSMPPLS